MPFPNRRVPLQDSLMCSHTSISKNEKERESLPSVSQPWGRGGSDTPPPPCRAGSVKSSGRARLHFGFLLTEMGRDCVAAFHTWPLPHTFYQASTCRVFIVQCTCICMYTAPLHFGIPLIKRGEGLCCSFTWPHTLYHVFIVQCTCCPCKF